MNEVIIANKKYLIAEDISELSQEQFLEFIRNIVMQDYHLLIDEAKMILLQNLLPIDIFEIDLEDDTIRRNLFQLMELLNGFFIETDEQWNVLFKSHHPIIRDLLIVDSYPAKDLLSHLTFNQYKELIGCLKSMDKSEDSIFVLRKIAMIVFGGKKPSKRFKEGIKELSEVYLTAIYHGVLSTLKYLAEEDISVDGNPISFVSLFKGNAGEANPFGLNAVLYQIAESGVIGTVKDVGETPYLEVLYHILYLMNKADKNK